MLARKMIHIKCRNNKYPFSDVQRMSLTDEQVPWNNKIQNYMPQEYEAPVLKNKPWADPYICNLYYMVLICEES